MDDEFEVSTNVLVGIVIVVICIIIFVIYILFYNTPTTDVASVQPAPVIKNQYVWQKNPINALYNKIAINNDGKIYALNASGVICYVGATSRGTLTQGQTSLTNLSVTNSTIVGSGAGVIYYGKIPDSNGSNIQLLRVTTNNPTFPHRDISLNNNNTIAGVNSFGVLVYTLDFLQQDWKTIPGEYNAASINNANNICTIDVGNNMWIAESFIDPVWVQIPGLPEVTFKQVKLTNVNVIFAIDTNNNMYTRFGGDWTRINHDYNVFDASINDKGIVCVSSSRTQEWSSTSVF